MRVFHIVLAISATLAVSAVPFPVGQSTTAKSNARKKPYGPKCPRGRHTAQEDRARPLQDPNIVFQHGGVPPRDYRNSRVEVLKDFHLFSTKSPASARIAKLADVDKDWVYLPDRQCLEFQYRGGMLYDSPVVPEGDRKIYRDIPPAKPLVLNFNRDIPSDERHELTGHITKYYNALPDNSPYRRADVTRVGEGWRPGGGDTDVIHDHVTFTSHSSFTHTDKNIIGEPHVILRPLTVSVGDAVEPSRRRHIERKVREHHKNIMDPTDKAKSSNVALVEGGPYWNVDGKCEVQAGFYKWPDRPNSDELIVDYGQRPVSLHWLRPQVHPG